MKLDTVEKRHEFIEKLLAKAFEFEETLTHDSEHQDDWGGAMSNIENIVKVEEFIRTEQILLDTLAEMESIKTDDDEGKQIFRNIANEALITFIDTVLLDQLEFTCNELCGRSFVTAGGVKFKKNFSKKLDTLIDTYQDLYDL